MLQTSLFIFHLSQINVILIACCTEVLTMDSARHLLIGIGELRAETVKWVINMHGSSNNGYMQGIIAASVIMQLLRE